MQRRAAVILLNVFSASRLVLAVAFVLIHPPLQRLLIVLFAGVTDVVDGRLARTKGLATRAGAIIDPLADRAFVLTALVTLTLEGTLQGWELALLVIRDLATGAAWVVTRVMPPFQQVAFQARPLGKMVTLLQFLSLVIAVVEPRIIGPLVLVTGAASILALADYGKYVWRERAV